MLHKCYETSNIIGNSLEEKCFESGYFDDPLVSSSAVRQMPADLEAPGGPARPAFRHWTGAESTADNLSEQQPNRLLLVLPAGVYISSPPPPCYGEISASVLLGKI
jgi:hypothetical protein